MGNARAILFYSVIGIFVATAILTLLGISVWRFRKQLK